MTWDFKWEFWKWFFIGLKTRSGISKLLLNRWSILHFCAGIGLALWIKMCPQDASQAILLPLAGILIGLSFAWSGNAQVLLQKKAIEKLTNYHPDGIEVYTYTFQSAILVILTTLVAWGLAGLGAFSYQNLEILCALFLIEVSCVLFFIEVCLYFLASLTLRECWSVVLFSQTLILARYHSRKISFQKNDKDQS